MLRAMWATLFWGFLICKDIVDRQTFVTAAPLAVMQIALQKDPLTLKVKIISQLRIGQVLQERNTLFMEVLKVSTKRFGILYVALG